MTDGVLDQQFEMVPVGELQMHPNNVNEGDVGSISESIKENGFFGACVVQRSTSYILVGNHRWLAAKARGQSHVPVLWVDVDDVRARKIMLVDNREAEKAHRDMARLAFELQDLIEMSGTLDGTGYDGDDLDEILADLKFDGDGDLPTDSSGMFGVSIVVDDLRAENDLVTRFTGEGIRVTRLSQ